MAEINSFTNQYKDGSNLYVVKQTLRKPKGNQQWQYRDTENIRNKAKTNKSTNTTPKTINRNNTDPLKKLEVNTGPHEG
jgi:hypothetical protein